MAQSPKEIQQLIDRATDNPQSLIEWLGNGGLKEVLTAINENSVFRGIMPFATTSSMALAGGTDAQFAVCLNGDAGLNFYRYYPNEDVSVFGAIPSNQGGQWRPIYASQDVFEGYWQYSAGKLSALESIRGIARLHLGEGGADDLWIDMPSTNSLGVAYGVRLAPMTTANMNSMLTPSDWMAITNTDSKMMLLQHPSVGFKSAGVYAGIVSSGAVSGSAITVTIPSQFVTSYKVLLTATDSATAAALASGYYISAKGSTTFTITFLSFASGVINFDYQISH